MLTCILCLPIINLKNRNFNGDKMLKKRIIFVLLFMTLALPSLFAQEEKMMSITVKKAQIRTKPSFLGKIRYTLEYADRVEVFDESKGWFLIGISTEDERGWIHSSALVKKKIVLKATHSDLDTNASGSEVALAGKGFNSQVEAEYITQNNVDYSWINIMETYEVDIEDAVLFLQEGEVYPQEEY